MSKTRKDSRDFKVQIQQEKGYTPKSLDEKYKRVRLNIRSIQDDPDDDTEE